MHTQRFIFFLSCNSKTRLKNLCRTGAYGLLVLFNSIKQVKDPYLAEGSELCPGSSAFWCIFACVSHYFNTARIH